MPSSPARNDRTKPAADALGPVLPQASAVSGPHRWFPLVPSSALLIKPLNAKLSQAVADLHEQAQVIGLVASASDQMADMSERAASELSASCGEALSAFGRLNDQSRLVCESLSTSRSAGSRFFASLGHISQLSQHVVLAVQSLLDGAADGFAKTAQSSDNLPDLLAQAEALQSACRDVLGQVSAQEQSAAAAVLHLDDLREAQTEVGANIERLAKTSLPLRQMAVACEGITLNLTATNNRIHRTAQRFDSACRQFEDLSELTDSDSDAQTWPIALPGFVSQAVLARDAANTCGAWLEQAIANGMIRAADLFDELCLAVPGASGRFMTASSCFLQEKTPSLLQSALAKGSGFERISLVDRNGYQPVCIPAASFPPMPILEQSGQSAGIILEDDTLLDAARSTQQTLLVGGRALHDPESPSRSRQTVCALFTPLRVGNRHWGSLRIDLILKSTHQYPSTEGKQRQ